MIGESSIISGANPIPWEQRGRERAQGAPPAGTFARAGQSLFWRSSDDGALSDDARSEVWRPDVARRRPIGEVRIKKKPAAVVRAGSAILRWWQYASDSPDESTSMMNVASASPSNNASGHQFVSAAPT